MRALFLSELSSLWYRLSSCVTNHILPLYRSPLFDVVQTKLVIEVESCMTEGRILVVDNEPQIRRVMRTTLIPEGFEVDDAKTGEEALEHLRSAQYDLVLLDINMPDMTGFQTCREIRAMSDLPIIMLTVRSADRDKVEALNSGADDYITKPFSTPELLARIRALLRRRSPSRPSPTRMCTWDASKSILKQGRLVARTVKCT